MPKFLKIIFCEYHPDPTTREILALLVPKLKDKGFSVFLDELPESHEALHKEMLEVQLTFNEGLKILHDPTKQDIAEKLRAEPDFMAWVDSLTDIETQRVLLYGATEILKGELALVDACDESNISRIHIDFQSSFITQVENGVFEIRANSKSRQADNVYAVQHSKERDVKFSEKYSTLQCNVFGRVGIAHTYGMQQQFLSKDTTSQYIFFHLRDSRLDTRACDSLLSLNYPMPLEIMDLSGQSEEDLVNQVAQKISSALMENNVSKDSYYDDNNHGSKEEITNKLLLRLKSNYSGSWFRGTFYSSFHAKWDASVKNAETTLRKMMEHATKKNSVRCCRFFSAPGTSTREAFLKAFQNNNFSQHEKSILAEEFPQLKTLGL